MIVFIKLLLTCGVLIIALSALDDYLSDYLKQHSTAKETIEEILSIIRIFISIFVLIGLVSIVGIIWTF